MKRIKGMALLLCMLMLAVLPCGVLAEESNGGTFEYRIVGGEAWITGYREKYLAPEESYDMVIPGTIEGCPVTRIEQDAFRDCNMRSVTVPDGVRIIGEGAFTNCRMVRAILPDSVVTIEDGVFASCTALTSVRLPSGLTEIGDRMFYYCGALTEIVIPESVTSIGDSAFFRCSSLKSIAISDTVSEMGYCAFYQCDALTDVYCEAEIRPDGWDEKWIVSCENAVVRWDSDGSIPLLAFGLVGGLAVFAIAFLILAAVIVLIVVLVKKKK